MCSISGIFSIRKKIYVEDFLSAYQTLEHRGPDDQGIVAIQSDGMTQHYHTDNTVESSRNNPHIKTLTTARVFLGHHRLSILDTSAHGHQPMERNNCILIYNGEIYNYREIRKELEYLGHTFTSTTDTEVVLTAYLHYGMKCFSLFNGMWALAIYNKKEKKLILSRDRFGIKPLYYSLDSQGLKFASEMKFFYKLGISTTNSSLARDYLIHMNTDHSKESMVNGIFQLPPASCLEYQFPDHTFKMQSYWKLKKKFYPHEISTQETIENIAEIFSSSVELRLRSDVGVGTLLSGGLDSTGVLSTVLQLTDSKQILHSYSSIFTDSKSSEHEDIYKTLSLWKKKVHPVFVEYGAPDVAQHIQSLLHYQDIPFRSLAVLSQYLIYEQIARDKNVTVLLNGQGADELFAGYTNHLFANLTASLTSCNLKRFVEESRAWRQWSNPSWMLIFKMVLKHIKRTAKTKWENKSAHGLNALTTLLYTNLTQASLPEYLRYEDRNSMAFSKESRLPFLDYRLVEFVFSLKDEFKIRNGVTKWSLREAFKSSIPEHIYNFRRKRGFISPQEEWQKSGFLKEWVDERMLKPSILENKEWNALNKKHENNTWYRWRVALFNEWENGSYKDT